jgi:hypothetical protein
MLKKKSWASFQRIIELFTQKFVTKLSKIWIWDRGSEKNLSRIWVQGSKRHRIPALDPQHCFVVYRKCDEERSSEAALGRVVAELFPKLRFFHK